MSVVIENKETGKIKVLTKGADSIVEGLLADKNEATNSLLKKSKEFVDDFSKEGLRTLFCAEREVPKDEFDEWIKGVKEAQNALENREERVAKEDEKIEVNLKLVGSTAIEDKLQDEVQDTIRFMKDTHIKVWVLTGDKVETAINIGISAGLIDDEKDMMRHIIKKKSTEKELSDALHKTEEKIKKFHEDNKDNDKKKQALIVDGPSLT